MLRSAFCLLLATAGGAAAAGAQSSEQALEQQIQALMTTSQNDHNAAVAIKTNTPGWLQGAPLAAEQADIAASQAALDQAEQLQLQLQAQQSGTATATSAGSSQTGHAHPWNCGPYPCTH